MNNELHKINLTGWVIGVSAFIVNVIIIFIIISSASDMSGETSNPVSDSEGFLMSTYTYDLPNGEKITSSSAKVYNQTWLNFDGVNDYVNLSNALNISGVLPNTFSVWFYPTSQTGSKSVFMESLITNRDGIYIKYDYDNQNVLHGRMNSTSSNELATSVNTVGKNKWTNIILVYDGSYRYIYINGNQFSRTASSVSINFNASSISALGNSKNLDSSMAFNGSIDDFFSFSTFLYPAQVNKLYSLRNNLTFIPILMYHDYSANSTPTTLQVNESLLRSQFSYLKSEGFVSITDKEYYNWTQNQGFVMPNKPFIMSWDDGGVNLTQVASIAFEYGYKGVLNVIVNFTNKTGYLTWDSISSMINNYDWSVASHSVNHCNLVTSCNTSDDFFREFSDSKSYIIGNLSYTPISFVYPINSYNSTTNDYCRQNYSLCFGDAKDSFNAYYAYKNTNLTDGSLKRISIYNSTTIYDFYKFLNYTLPTYYRNLNFNENSGTTSYDSSGNGNNGTISGATWQNDGVLVSLTEDTDFSINKVSGVVTLLNPVYLFSYITASWTESNIDDSVSVLRGNVSAGVDVISGKIPILFLVLIIGVILIVLGGLTALFYLLMKKVPSRFSGGV